MHANGFYVVGALHPDPIYEMPISYFPHVPFSRMKWPAENNTIEIEWTIYDVNATECYYRPIIFSVDELRT